MGKAGTKFLNFDYFFLGICSLLIILGFLALINSSLSFSRQNFGSSTYIIFHQIKFGLLPGILLGGVCFFLPLPVIKKWAPAALLGTFILLGMVFLPKIGFSAGGAARWIKVGSASFQPSELLKIVFILYLAFWMAKREEGKLFKKNRNLIKTIRPKHSISLTGSLVPFLIIIGLISLFLIFQPDISTLGIIVLTAIAMYFVSGAKPLHAVFLILGGISGLIGLIVLAPYRLNRLLTFLKADADPMGMSYQIKQSLIAIGSGGVFGKGMGLGIQKFGFLPQPISDSVFAVFAEETGFIGSVILIALFLIFAWRGLKIAKRAPDKFARVAAVGIISWITIQSFVNIGAIIGILPLTGIPLPFFSYGSSHFIIELMAVGIMLNISKQTP